MPGMKDFAGKVVVVTGAANGIGREMSLAFARRGARLALADIDGEGLRKVRAELDALGTDAYIQVVDVSVAAEVETFRDSIYREMGKVDVLCNNAGVALGGDFELMTLGDMHWQVGANLMGVIHGCHYFYPRMLAQGSGHIVNTASAAGLIPFSGLALYSGTKHGVVGLSETLRAEAALHGIGITVICPGVIATDIVKRSRIVAGSGRSTSHELAEKMDRILQSRGFTPDRVARAAVRAVARDTGVARITPETYALDWLHRFSRAVFGLMMKTGSRAARSIL